MKKGIMALCLATVSLAVEKAAAETYVLDTFYPAPVGAYNSIMVTSSAVLARDTGVLQVGVPAETPVPYKLNVAGAALLQTVQLNSLTDAQIAAGAVLLKGESVPGPGRIFYNVDLDAFYFTSKNAVENDKETWYKPMTGTTTKLLAHGISNFYKTTSKFAYLTFTPTVGTVTSGARVLNSARQYKGSLLQVTYRGDYCIEMETEEITPSFKLLYRPSNSTTWRVAYNGVVPIDATAAPTSCGDFEVAGLVFMAPSKGVNFQFAVQAKKDVDSARKGKVQNVKPGELEVLSVMSF